MAGASEQLQEEARDNVDDKVPLVHGVPEAFVNLRQVEC